MGMFLFDRLKHLLKLGRIPHGRRGRLHFEPITEVYCITLAIDALRH
jgi:hypothetical protein